MPSARKLQRACLAPERSGGEYAGRVDLLDPLDVPARLDELRAMQDGWLDGAGKAPSHAGLDWLADAFARHYPDDAPLPYAYPTPEGGVQFEWTLGVHDISLEVNLNDRTAIWHRLDLSDVSDEGQEQELNLTNDRRVGLGQRGYPQGIRGVQMNREYPFVPSNSSQLCSIRSANSGPASHFASVLSIGDGPQNFRL